MFVRLPFSFPLLKASFFPSSFTLDSLFWVSSLPLSSPLLLCSSCLHPPVFLLPSSFPLSSGPTLGQNLLSFLISLPLSSLFPSILSPFPAVHWVTGRVVEPDYCRSSSVSVVSYVLVAAAAGQCGSDPSALIFALALHVNKVSVIATLCRVAPFHVTRPPFQRRSKAVPRICCASHD